MELDDNETVVHSDPVDVQALTSKVSELDLYAELTAFAELSPDEQAQLIERQKEAFAQASMTSAAHSEQTTSQQPDLKHSSSEPVEPEPTASDAQTPGAAEVEHDALSNEASKELTSEPVHSEQAATEGDTPCTQESEEYPSLEQPSTYLAVKPAQSENHSEEQVYEQPSTYLTIDPAQSETLQVEQADEYPSEYLAIEPDQTETRSAEDPNSSEPHLIHEPDIPVVFATVAGPESVLDSEGSDALGELNRDRPPEVEVLRPSGPLSGFNLPANIVYTGSLARGVCLSCGAAESGADDLFCPACGVFIDEIGSTVVVASTCVECNQVITADEIFCPWCGSALPV
jgi:hypothetical protein